MEEESSTTALNATVLNDHEFHLAEGRLLQKNGVIDLAGLHFQMACELAPESIEAGLVLTQFLLDQDDTESALDNIDRLLIFHPHNLELQLWLALVQQHNHQLMDALKTLQQLLRMAPGYGAAQRERARLEKKLALWPEADRSYRRYLQLQPDDLNAKAEWAALLGQMGQSEAAGEVYLQLYCQNPTQGEFLIKWINLRAEHDPHMITPMLIQLAHEHPELRSALALQMATMMEYTGDEMEMRRCMQMALEDPLLPDKHAWKLRLGLHLPYLVSSRKELEQELQTMDKTLTQYEKEWPDSAHIKSDFSNLHPYLRIWTPFCFMPYHNVDPLPWRKRWGSLFQAMLPSQPFIPGPRLKENTHNIGVVLNNNTAVNAFLLQMLWRWPTDLGPLQLYFVPLPDGTPIEIGQLGESFIEHSLPNDYAEAVDIIRNSHLDLLFITEVHTDRLLQSLLASLRLAPIQVTSWLSSGSTGLSTMDYFISSTLLEQSENPQRFYSEELILIDELPGMIQAPVYLQDPPTRSAYGLPEGGRIYLCPQVLFKYHPDFDVALSGILEKDPQGILVLLHRPDNPYLRNILLQRFEKNFPHLMPRIWLMPRLNYQEYLGLLLLADVMLDPFYFGGGTTSLDGLGLGVPIITWPGERLHGRITYGYYRKMELDDAIAYHPQDYIDKAVALANQPHWNQDFRGRILEAVPLLFNNEASVHAVANALRSFLAH